MKHEMMRASIRTRRFLLCPACDQGEAFYEHLEAGAKTRWHCDHCGAFYDVEIDADGTALVGLTHERTIKTLYCSDDDDPSDPHGLIRFRQVR
jgi:uncharacterized protein (DUF983 family)